jgi:hypothetical protein
MNRLAIRRRVAVVAEVAVARSGILSGVSRKQPACTKRFVRASDRPGKAVAI